MASIIYIPFNFQTVSNTRVLNASYTVPTGKYAIVNINGNIIPRTSYNVGVNSASTGGDSFGAMSRKVNLDFTTYLKAGDVISATVNTNVLTISVNGTVCFRESAPTMDEANSVDGPWSTVFTGGSSSYGIVAQEFLIYS